MKMDSLDILAFVHLYSYQNIKQQMQGYLRYTFAKKLLTKIELLDNLEYFLCFYSKKNQIPIKNSNQ